MNENSSKQVLLSILGIAVLAVAVVGVSFAFFSYSKTGTTNNVITTGSISFSFSEAEQGITLVDEFPQTYAGDNDTFEFKVSGNLPATSAAVSYTVTAVAGETAAGKQAANRLADSEVHVKVTATGGGNVTGNYATGAAAGNSATGFQIASGTIAANGTAQEHAYSMTMWVNNTVTISDTDTSKTYCASTAECQGSRKVYSDMYYSLKVNVQANS